MFEKMGRGVRTLWRKLTGGQGQEDKEDGGDAGRQLWEFHEDCELVLTFLLNPDKKKKEVFSMVASKLERWDEGQVSNRFYKYVRGDEEYMKLIMKHISFNLNISFNDMDL